MPKLNWNLVGKEHIETAIIKYLNNNDNQGEPYARNTFLLYGSQLLPAKYIRGLAYKEATGYEPAKGEYSGGDDTAIFFKKRGFKVRYKNAIDNSIVDYSMKEDKSYRDGSNDTIDIRQEASVNVDFMSDDKLKIGLYLQSDSVKNMEGFEMAKQIVQHSSIDLLVFPEFSWTPFFEDYRRNNIYASDFNERLVEDCLELSRELGCAIIVNDRREYSEDEYEYVGVIFSIYANAFAKDDETEVAETIKHIQTDYSILEFERFETEINKNFPVISLKGFRIGMTICYDCTDALFSRIYGKKGVDILINSTGGDVVKEKWYRYVRARAIENHCYSLTTMGCDNPKRNFVMGFYPNGNMMTSQCLNGVDDGQNNLPGGIYVYEISKSIKGNSDLDEDFNINQTPTIVKYKGLAISENFPRKIFDDSKKLSDHIYLKSLSDGLNLIIIRVVDHDIFYPEKIIPYFYSSLIDKIPRKRFIIFSDFSCDVRSILNSTLSLILKVRSMENFCPVVLSADNITMVVQTCSTKNIQIIKSDSGTFWLDLNRASGPQILRNSNSRLGSQIRTNYEWMINNLLDK